jgi:putative chitinase
VLKDFINNYPFGKLTDKQKPALDFIIHKLELSSIQIQRQQAYVLATIHIETNFTYEPVVEGYYLGKNRISKLYHYYKENNPKALTTIFPEGIDGANYLGRGLVQITHLYNYELFTKLLRIDLVHNPELALVPENAWNILEQGMTKGLFTGKKLSDYFNDEETEWYEARKIINGKDRAIEFGEIAQKIYQTINHIEPKDIPEPRD